ncbi:hypothetical protein HAX54_048675, partial [Datura stramonium]|nr:hypothetical protein [Datura stramonium]
VHISFAEAQARVCHVLKVWNWVLPPKGMLWLRRRKNHLIKRSKMKKQLTEDRFSSRERGKCSGIQRATTDAQGEEDLATEHDELRLLRPLLGGSLCSRQIFGFEMRAFLTEIPEWLDLRVKLSSI